MKNIEKLGAITNQLLDLQEANINHRYTDDITKMLDPKSCVELSRIQNEYSYRKRDIERLREEVYMLVLEDNQPIDLRDLTDKELFELTRKQKGQL